MSLPSPEPASLSADSGESTAWLSRRTLETVALVHLGVMLLLAAWAFGGNIEWARRVLSWWGSLAVPITVAALRPSAGSRFTAWRQIGWLLPWAALVALVLGSCLNPSFTNRTFDGQEMSVHLGEAHPWLPSTVNPRKTLYELWFSAGAYLSGFNLLLTVRRRRALRGLLTVACLGVLLVISSMVALNTALPDLATATSARC